MNAVDELNFLLGIGPPRPQLPITLQRSGYTAVRTLGKGSFGQALLVFHKARQTYYVVKHVNMANMNARQRKDAHNEITVLQQLHHPNIVRYEDCFEEPPHLYIVMEHADGGDLFSHLAKVQQRRRPFRSPGLAGGEAATGGWLTEAQVISLFVQTTMAVKYMHDRRLLHRDIKSQNVFLTKQHVVKLGDFGITMVLQNTVAMASTMCGTPCYFSPELCLGKPYNNKSDVWALGVLLYELCAGHVPFESTTMKSLMREIVNKEPPRIPATFSTALWELVQWMLQKDPKKRPDAGQVLNTPVLMRHIPDIIAQLEQAQLATTATPTAAAAADQDGQRRHSQAAGGAGADPEAASSPYYELLHQQQQQRQQQQKQPAGRTPIAAAQGRNPFSPETLNNNNNNNISSSNSAVPAAMDEEAYIADYRRRLQEKHQLQQDPQRRAPQPGATPSASPTSANPSAPPITSSNAVAAAAAALKAPSLSPQLRAVLSKGTDKVASPPSPPQRGVEKPANRDNPSSTGAGRGQRSTPSTNTATATAAAAAPPPVTSAGASAAAMAQGDRPSIEALLVRFDLEKKRIQGEKQQEKESRQQPKPQATPASATKGQPSAGPAGADAAQSKRPKPLSAADQEGLMTKQAAAAATSALDMLRTPSAAVAAREKAADPRPDQGTGTSAAQRTAATNPPLPPPPGSTSNASAAPTTGLAAGTAGGGVGGGSGGDLDKMMKEMHAYFHCYQQRRRSDSGTDAAAAPSSRKASADMAAAAGGALPSPSSSSSSPSTATPKTAVSDQPPEKARADSSAKATAQGSTSKGSASPRTPVADAVFEDPAGACLDIADIQKQHDQLRQQPPPPSGHSSQSRATNGAHTGAGAGAGGAGSMSASLRATTPRGSSSSNGGSSSQAAPTDIFMSSLNRRHQHTASVNAMARAHSPTHTLNDTPSPPPNRFLAGSTAAGSSSSGPSPGTAGSPEVVPSATAALMAVPSPSAHAVDEAAVAEAAVAEAAPLDLPFGGQCLCGAVQLNGWFSTIYGSFVCNCEACCRLSGSTLGVEWLHVPNASSMVEMLEARHEARGAADSRSSEPMALAAAHPRALLNGRAGGGSGEAVESGGGSSASGSGAAAVALLQQQASLSRVPSITTVAAVAAVNGGGGDVHAARSYRFEMLLDVDEADTDDNDDDNDDDEARRGSRGAQYVASFWKHFCACCGTTVGLQHDGLEGVLLPKSVLDEESEAVLRRFARTVAPSGEEDDAEPIGAITLNH